MNEIDQRWGRGRLCAAAILARNPWRRPRRGRGRFCAAAIPARNKWRRARRGCGLLNAAAIFARNNGGIPASMASQVRNILLRRASSAATGGLDNGLLCSAGKHTLRIGDLQFALRPSNPAPRPTATLRASSAARAAAKPPARA